jgi:hypothetical protein
MLDIFSNLAIRNSGLPSPEVLQPRLPTLFDPAGLVAGHAETFSSQALSSANLIAGSTEKGQSMPLPSGHVTSSADTLLHEETVSNEVTQQLYGEQMVQPRDIESARKMTSQQASQAQLPGTIHSFASIESLDESQSNTRRSAKVASPTERPSVSDYKNDSHWMKENVEERVVRPRMESLAANKAEGNNHSPRSVPGGGEKSMNIVLPHEESQQEEAPVVRIHIGRIDVRAITQAPAQPASKPAPAQPRLTLDDYLRQREGRR